MTPNPGLTMQTIHFGADTMRFTDVADVALDPDEGVGFSWVFLDRDELDGAWPLLQDLAARLGGSPLIDLHCRDLGNAQHPSHYDYTSVYDLVIFRRLASEAEVAQEGRDAAAGDPAHKKTRAHAHESVPPAFRRIASRAVGFAIFDRLLITVHPSGCHAARSFIERFVGDAKLAVDATGARNRIPLSPADLALRMINFMVDSYLELRKDLSTQLEHWQAELLSTRSRFNNWGALMAARGRLQLLEDLCDEQHDAMQEWLDTLSESPAAVPVQAASHAAHHDHLVARARDVIEHVERVVHHVRRLEQSAETAVQIHFSIQSNRANDIMRTLTALTAIFLPLNLITGFFGMNFEFMPLIHREEAFWWVVALMAFVATGTGLLFWRKRYLASRQP